MIRGMCFRFCGECVSGMFLLSYTCEIRNYMNYKKWYVFRMERFWSVTHTFLNFGRVYQFFFFFLWFLFASSGMRRLRTWDPEGMSNYNILISSKLTSCRLGVNTKQRLQHLKRLTHYATLHLFFRFALGLRSFYHCTHSSHLSVVDNMLVTRCSSRLAHCTFE